MCFALKNQWNESTIRKQFQILYELNYAKKPTFGIYLLDLHHIHLILLKDNVLAEKLNLKRFLPLLSKMISTKELLVDNKKKKEMFH